MTESQNGTPSYQVCSDAYTVGSDSYSVNSDGDSVTSTAYGLESDVTSGRNAISATQQDLSALQSAEAQQPSYNDNAAHFKRGRSIDCDRTCRNIQRAKYGEWLHHSGKWHPNPGVQRCGSRLSD